MAVRLLIRTTPFVLAGVLAGSLAHVAPVSAVVADPPVFLGMATLNIGTVYPEFEARTGRYPAMHQVFWKLDDPWSQVTFDNHADALDSYGMAFYAEIHTDDLDALVSGVQDSALDALVSQVAAGLARRPSLRVLIAPLPEMNLSNFPWGLQPDGFKAAYQKIHDAFRVAGLGPDKVRFVFSVNGEGTNAAGHDNTMFHTESYALVMQQDPKAYHQFDIDFIVDKVAMTQLYGTKEMRDDHAVFMKGT